MYLQRNVCTSSQARAFRAKNSINSYLSRRHSGTVLTTKDVNLFAFIKRRGRVAFQRMRHESDPFDTLKRFMLAHQFNCTRTIATLWIAVKLIMDTTVITIITGRRYSSFDSSIIIFWFFLAFFYVLRTTSEDSEIFIQALMQKKSFNLFSSFEEIELANLILQEKVICCLCLMIDYFVSIIINISVKRGIFHLKIAWSIYYILQYLTRIL